MMSLADISEAARTWGRGRSESFNSLLRWSHAADIDAAVIEPGKPWQNGSNESFKLKFWDECLAMEWFRNQN
jgi:hypothetical protein